MKRIVCVLLAGVLAVLVLAGCGKAAPASRGEEEEKVVSDIGGVTENGGEIEGNGGFAVSDGKFVYYIYDEQIRRVAAGNLHGESELVYDGEARGLALSQDGRLYFVSEGGLSWVRYGDKDKTDLIKSEQIGGWSLAISEDWLYFCINDYDDDSYAGGIYRMDVKTSEVVPMVDGKEHGAGEYGFDLAGDLLYYYVHNEESGLMKTDMVTGESSFMFNDRENEHLVDWHITDEYIYFGTRESATSGVKGDTTIKRIGHDGQNEQDVCVVGPMFGNGSEVGIIYADAEFVYFENDHAGSEYYRAKADGTGSVEQIAKDWEDGATGEIVWDGSWTSVGFVAGKIFFDFNPNTYRENSRSQAVYCVGRDGKNGFNLS
jgi:hypothetical protein